MIKNLQLKDIIPHNSTNKGRSFDSIIETEEISLSNIDQNKPKNS
jgi:hypothetical protein